MRTLFKIILTIVGLVFAIGVISGIATNDDKRQTGNTASLDSGSFGWETAGQENARESAESYLESGSFSRRGLIEQLSSEYGEGYSKADAIYAVDALSATQPDLWRQQAAKAARSYLESSSFSRRGLIDQLESPYGEGFTHAQAVYGVNAAY
jgi:hypothetical protein